MSWRSYNHNPMELEQMKQDDAAAAFESWCDQNEETVLCAVYNALVENPNDHPFTVGQIMQMRHEIEDRLYEKHCADREAGDE